MDLITLGSYAAGILIFMSTARMLLINDAAGLPILTYISFSNLSLYILHVLYSLTRYIILTLLIFIFKAQLFIIMQFVISITGALSFFLVIFVLGIALASRVMYNYWGLEKYEVNKLGLLIYIGLGLFGICAKYYYHVTDTNLVLFFIMFMFCWLYTKIGIQYEIKANKDMTDFNSIIVFKDPSRPNFQSNHTRYIKTNTDKFIFIFNEDDKTCTTIPMSEVFTMNINGTNDQDKNKIQKTLKE